MAHGEVVASTPLAADWQEPASGPLGDAALPLTAAQLELLDDVIFEAERITGLRYSVYLGDLGTDTRNMAEGLVKGLGADGPYTVLLAVSPGQKVVEVVTGAEAAQRVSDRSARLAVLSVVAACADGDISGALVNGVRMLADQAGTLPERTNW